MLIDGMCPQYDGADTGNIVGELRPIRSSFQNDDMTKGKFTHFTTVRARHKWYFSMKQCV
jgi:hypothetical protein